MFDGSFKQRREINLSGKSRKTSRQKLVQNTKQLREERRQKQLLNASSIKIQKLYRGYKCRKLLSNFKSGDDDNNWLIVSMKLSPWIKPWVDLKSVLLNDVLSDGNYWDNISSIAFCRICISCIEVLYQDGMQYDKKCVVLLSEVLNHLQSNKLKFPPNSLLYPCLRTYFWGDEQELIQLLLKLASLEGNKIMLSYTFFAYGDIKEHSLFEKLNQEYNFVQLLELLSLDTTLLQKNGKMVLYNAYKLLNESTITNMRIMLRLLHSTLVSDSNFNTWCSAIAADVPLSSFNKNDDVILEDDSSSDHEEEYDTRQPKKEYIIPSKLSKLKQNEALQLINSSPSPPEQYHELINHLTCSKYLYTMSSILFSSSSNYDDFELYISVILNLLSIGSFMNYTSSVRIFSQPLLLQLSFPDKTYKNILLDNLHKIICLSPSSSKFISADSITKAQVLFCEIFTSMLLPIRDEELYTIYGSYLPSVIEWLSKHCLYDLYYSHPILVDDNALRLRLFLSGTKLYNALHERYSRCGDVDIGKRLFGVSEDDWYFPAMIWDSNSMDVDTKEDEDLSRLIQTNPKISRILTSLPQCIPFVKRVDIFTTLLEADKRSTQSEPNTFIYNMMEDSFSAARHKLSFTIRRNHLYDDAFKAVLSLQNPKHFKRQVQVTFINQHGAEEAGIDGGGLVKEFLDDLIVQSFDPKWGFFSVSSPTLQTLVIDPSNMDDGNLTDHYLFLGRVLGKAVYEGILVEPQFSLPLLNKLAGRNNTLDDLKNLDDTLYNNLIKLRTMSPSELSSLELTFEYQGVELIPNGSTTPVTSSNVIRFLHTLANYKLNLQNIEITRAFLQGFKEIISPVWIRLFSTLEIQKLISGDDTPLNIPALKAIMQYSGGYHISQPYVQSFWEVLEEMTPKHQQLFLKFMTSCSRQPLLGFGSLTPIPCIQQVRLMPSDGNLVDQRLPTASTCMNLLKLPNYGDKEVLRNKLLYSIQAGAGFELS